MSEKDESEYRLYSIDPEKHIPSEYLAVDLDIDVEANDGIIPKIWNEDNELGNCLFKVAHRSPKDPASVRVDWAEKVVSEIANLLGIPTAKYEFATTYFQDNLELVEGIISINCVPTGSTRRSGEYILNQIINDESEGSQEYTIENIFKALDLAEVRRPSRSEKLPDGINSGAEVFISYLMLDALVDNWDRHPDNWSIIVGEEIELMPCYDYGEALASGETDEYKKATQFDNHNQIPSSPFTNQEGTKRLSMLEVFERAAELKPQAAKIWIDQLAALDPDEITKIFNRIPEGRITEVSANFAKGLIEYNRTELLRPYQLELENNRNLIGLGDLNNYRDYLKSPEYRQTLPSRTLSKMLEQDGRLKQYRTDYLSAARTETGNNRLSFLDPFLATFKVELNLTEADRNDLQAVRKWAAKKQLERDERPKSNRERNRDQGGR
jgi:hypothetical protein